MSDSYFGGKNGAGVAERLINAIPRHDRLIVPFAGHCAVTRKIFRASRTVVCDLDQDVIKWWKVHRDDSIEVRHESGLEYLAAEFSDNAGKVAEFSVDRANPYSAATSELEVATPNQSASAEVAEFRGTAATQENATFVFCDPPYPHETRGKSRYRFDWESQTHKRFLDLILGLPCNVMVCTYPNDLYAQRLGDWRSFTYESMTRGGYPKTEIVYCNYDFESCILHDYRYLGRDRREREKLKRRETNLINRIRSMPARERERYLQRIRIEFF